ncbi:MAG: GNAT family N-acetyltransferase [Microcoleus sp. SU_5_3]|nr:GNAT family N-acetyltransferase [Microcoleus sp. SU_5_3]
MEISIEDRETLERLEEELWCEETRYDKQRMNELLAGDFFEFGRSGRIYQKQDTLAHSRKTINAVFPLPEFHARLLDENTAQVTYNSVANYDGVVEYARRSSIWSRTNCSWILRFHQGTPFQPGINSDVSKYRDRTAIINAITYRFPKIGDEQQISACLWAAADLWELADETPESIDEWKQISNPEELRSRIASNEKTLVAIWNGIVVGFIAFRRGNHLSLLFVRKEFSGLGIGRELFTRCSSDFDESTVNSSDTAVEFYQKIGFVQSGDRFLIKGIWGTPMKWTNRAANQTR